VAIFLPIKGHFFYLQKVFLILPTKGIFFICLLKAIFNHQTAIFFYPHKEFNQITKISKNVSINKLFSFSFRSKNQFSWKHLIGYLTPTRHYNLYPTSLIVQYQLPLNLSKCRFNIPRSKTGLNSPSYTQGHLTFF